MKKKYLLIILIAQMVFAQAPTIEWQKCLGGSGFDYAQKCTQTLDGGYVVIGYSYSTNGDVTGSHGNADYWIVKLNALGTLQWQKSLGGTASDFGQSVQQTTDGGYIVAGYSNSTNGDVTANHGNADYWIIKLDTGGTIQWQTTLGGTANDNATSIKPTTDGGYIVAGYSNSTNGDATGNHGGGDCWIVKINALGTIQWQKSLGGTLYEYAYDIQQTTDGGYIVAGYSNSIDGDVTVNKGNNDYWIVKLDTSGLIQWQKSLGGTGNDFAHSIQQTTDGGYIVAGYSNSTNNDVTGNHGGNDYWIVKLDTLGIIQWQKSLGGSYNDQAYSIQQTTDGGFIVAGHVFSISGDVTVNQGNADYWIVKLDALGILQWQKSFGGAIYDYANSIQQTTDGGYILAGYSDSINGDVTANHGGGDYWVVKLSQDALETSSFTTFSFKLFPNPTSSVLTLQSFANLVFDKMVVVDLTGKTVLATTQNTNQINVEELASGMYILQAFLGPEQFTVKFVKE